jgi:LPPG:FO 2-phospho-L-lactate transferase
MMSEGHPPHPAGVQHQRIVVISGGVGGAKFVRGLRHALHEGANCAGGGGPAGRPELSVVVNTGDDMWLHGLRICPDLDSVMYALAGVNDTQRGWGRAEETDRVAAELTAYGMGQDWFTLGDLDLATHIARTSMLRDGIGLAEATRRLCARWNLGATLLPATEQEVETIVRVGDGPNDLMHLEEWWVRLRASVPALDFLQRDVAGSRPGPGVLDAIGDADLILIAPSNPVVSVGTILGIPGIADALRAADAPVIGLSPIIGDAPVAGMAAQCLTAVGVEVSAFAVAERFGSRANGGILDGWLVDANDAEALPRLAAIGLKAAAVPLWMSSDEATAEMARRAFELAY